MEVFTEGSEALFGLIALGLLLFVVEMVVPGFGVFGLLGLAAFGFGEYCLVTQGNWFPFFAFIVCFAFILLSSFLDLYFCVSASTVSGLSGFVYLLVKGMDLYVLYSLLGFLLLGLLIFLFISRSTTWIAPKVGKSGKSLVGSKGTATSDFGPDGSVRITYGKLRRVHEDWTAIGSSASIRTGDKVVVVDVCGNVLRVEKEH